MKKVRVFMVLVFITALFGWIGCDDSESPDPLVTLQGKVSYTNAAGAATNAPGAVVHLTNSSAEVVTTISDADGDYLFINVSSGDYTLSSSFFTDNKNVSARFGGLTFITESEIAVTVESTDLTKDIALVSTGQSGLEAVTIDYAWNGTAYANAAGAWTYDATHTTVNFEFGYRQNVESDFAGTFSQLSKAKINIDPNNLATSSIDVEVDVASFSTRSPGGRDPRTTVDDTPLFNPGTLFKEMGCVMGTFGITANGGTPTNDVPLTITTTKRYAQFVSTSIAKFGDGFVAKGNLTFLGITKPVDIWFKGAPAWTDPSNNRKYAGFEGRFIMMAKTDYAVNSSSVNDAPINVQISVIAYKQL